MIEVQPDPAQPVRWICNDCNEWRLFNNFQGSISVRDVFVHKNIQIMPEGRAIEMLTHSDCASLNFELKVFSLLDFATIVMFN